MSCSWNKLFNFLTRSRATAASKAERQKTLRRAMQMESLESRAMFAVDVGIVSHGWASGNAIVINGSNGSDNVIVRMD